jgi:RNA polymerase sigma factor (sigma-70 family)
VQSNDWFVAPQGGGLPLFDEDGMPMTGDVSDMLGLYDAGTEVDETPGEGDSQPPRQSGPNTGDADPDSSVRMVENRSAMDYLEAELSYDEESGFTLTLTNMAAGADVETPFAPGVFAVGSGMNVLFTEGTDDRGEGLEALAEDGGFAELAETLAGMTGLTTPLTPGVWVVHEGGMPLYEDGVMDAGRGLEVLAEDGDPSELADGFEKRAFDELFRRHARALFGLFLRHGLGEADARDLVQQSFFRAHQAHRDFDPARKLKPWLWTIGLNAMRDQKRKNTSRSRLSFAVSDLKQVSSQRREEEPETRATIRAALGELSEPQREVLLLHYYEQFTFSEISEVLSLTESAVRVRAHRAYQSLRQILGSGGEASHGLS